jgi:hypothetical protein
VAVRRSAYENWCNEPQFELLNRGRSPCFGVEMLPVDRYCDVDADVDVDIDVEMDVDMDADVDGDIDVAERKKETTADVSNIRFRSTVTSSIFIVSSVPNHFDVPKQPKIIRSTAKEASQILRNGANVQREKRQRGSRRRKA